VHMAALAYQDIPAFMTELRQRQHVAARALEFCILTATRTGETLKARWPEMNLDDAVWSIPKERTKTDKPHRVPLSDAAVALLRALPREEGDVVFIGPRAGRGLIPTAMLLELQALRPGITVHGTARSSFRDWAGESTAFPHDVCEAALAHIRGDKAVEAYARGDLFEKRRGLMAAWSRYCSTPPVIASGTVTPIRASVP
jgi:integrase